MDPEQTSKGRRRKRVRGTVVATLTLTLLACLGCWAASAGAKVPARAPSAHSGRGAHAGRGEGRAKGGHPVYMANDRLAGAAVSRPKTYLVAGKRDFRIGGIAWRRYGGAQAIGKGVAKLDSCKPSCARGKAVSYPLELRASRPRASAGRRFYTRLSLAFGARHPRGQRRLRLDISPLAQGAPAVRKLARGIAAASTPAGREGALLAAMHTLGIGVYTGLGGQVEAGFESGPRGIYLYDFEIRALSGQLERGELASFDQLAAALGVAGITLGGKTPTGALLASATARGIAKLHGQASTPEAALGLLVRDLGLARHLDLAKPQSSSVAILDPVQLLLLTIDLARADATRGGAGAAAGRLAARPAAAPAVARAADSCSSSAGSFVGAAGTGSIGASILIGKGITPRAVITKEVLEGVHGVALAYSFHFVALATQVSGAFGSNGPGSGAPVRFQVQASLLDGVPSSVNCGALAGEGPTVSGIPIDWEMDYAGHHLEYLGTVICDAICTATGPDGVATLTLYPDDELLPGVGPALTEIGTVQASAEPQHAAGNVLGSIAEDLGITKFATIGYSVRFHDPGGYRVEIPAIVTHAVRGNWNVTFTDHVENQEICLPNAATPLTAAHPLQPPLGIGGPAAPGSGLSIVGSAALSAGIPPDDPRASRWSEEEVESDGSESIGPFEDESGYPALMPAAWDGPPLGGELGTGAGIGESGDGLGPLEVAAQWRFDSPTLHAMVTARRSGADPGSQIFDLPVTQAQVCPSPSG